jgi:hypothetical protein
LGLLLDLNTVIGALFLVSTILLMTVFRGVWVETNDVSKCVLRNSSHAVGCHYIMVTTRGEWLWTQWGFANCAIG